jgi:hypothetical protein
MDCFWVILLILVALAVVLGIRGWQHAANAKRKRKEEESLAADAKIVPQGGGTVNKGQAPEKPSEISNAMSPFVRDILGCYLVILAIFLSYTIYRLLAVEFPPDPATVQQAAAQTGAPAPATMTTDKTVQPAATPSPAQGTPTPAPAPIVPIISRVVPSTISTYSQPPSLTVYGSNFSNQSSVRINGDPLSTAFVSTSELRGSLEKDKAEDKNKDKGKEKRQLEKGTVFVDVVNGDAFSNALSLQVISYGKLYWCTHNFDIGPEARLILLVLLAGALGSFIHALQSLIDFSGNTTLKASWTWWYIARPFLGMALAMVFYAALRGGMLAGTPAAVKDVNPYGIFTIAALAGMFSDKATQKLADIFDVLFKADDNRKDKLKKVTIKTTSLPDGKVNVTYPPRQLEANDGAAPYAWSATDLPQGLILDSHTGIISGTPTAVGKKSVALIVKDSSGDTDTKSLDFNILS